MHVTQDGCCIQEDQCETPDLDFLGWSEELPDVEWFRLYISTISVELIADKLSFLLFQEAEGRLLHFLVGELADEDVGEERDRAGDDALLPILLAHCAADDALRENEP